MSNGESITRFCFLSDVLGYAADGVLLRILESDEVAHILKLAKALWTYQGEPCKEKPHALLASGNHSNGFVMVGAVIKEHPSLCALFAHSLALSVVRYNPAIPLNVNWVVGADTSSTALAGDVARFFNAFHLKMKKTEKAGEKAIQVWSPENKESSIFLPGQGLQVEELITTAHSALQVREGMDKVAPAHFNFGKVLATIVNRSDPRSPVEMIGDSKVISLLRLEISNFEPHQCPYCAAGSEAIAPKKEDNWQRLTA
jgi:orotate phosphoribosyltransferase